MLNKLEIDQLQPLLSNEAVLKIIEKVFNETLDNNMPQVHILDNNEKLGEKFRAYNEAKGIIRTAFSDLLSYKNEVTKDEKIVNKTR